MRHRLAGVAIVAAGLGLALAAAAARAGDEPYIVKLAFDASFDTEGRVTALKPHDEAEHSAALWNQLKTRLGSMKLPPVKGDDGQPATFRTGLYVSLEVSQGSGGAGGQVRLKGIEPRPLVLSKTYDAVPEELAKAEGWTGEVTASCTVGVDGRCGEVKVDALPGLSQPVLRWAADSMARWRFQPPEIGGKPVAAPVREQFSMSVGANIQPVNFLNKNRL